MNIFLEQEQDSRIRDYLLPFTLNTGRTFWVSKPHLISISKEFFMYLFTPQSFGYAEDGNVCYELTDGESENGVHQALALLHEPCPKQSKLSVSPSALVTIDKWMIDIDAHINLENLCLNDDADSINCTSVAIESLLNRFMALLPDDVQTKICLQYPLLTLDTVQFTKKLYSDSIRQFVDDFVSNQPKQSVEERVRSMAKLVIFAAKYIDNENIKIGGGFLNALLDRITNELMVHKFYEIALTQDVRSQIDACKEKVAALIAKASQINKS